MFGRPFFFALDFFIPYIVVSSNEQQIITKIKG